MNLNDDNLDLYVMPGSSFLEPGVDDESNNWANRGALLSSYRALVAKLTELDTQVIQ